MPHDRESYWKLREARDIADGNDLIRENLASGPWARIVMTATVHQHPRVEEILKAVQEFKSFDKANDPHGEHDFGAVTVEGKQYFWKFDYYDTEFKYGSDPYTEEVFRRVLTIMRADEY